MRIPVISAVGHETDFTIADFVADIRAPTPSAAAELAVPIKQDLVDSLSDYALRLRKSAQYTLEAARNRLELACRSRYMVHPEYILNDRMIYLDRLTQRLNDLTKSLLTSNSSRLESLKAKLESLSPQAVLARGFALITNEKGIIKTINAVETGDNVNIIFSDGTAGAVIKNRGERNERKKNSNDI